MGRTSGQPPPRFSWPVLSNADQKQQEKKKKRDKQLILEVVLATYVCLRDSILKVRLSQTKCLHVSQAEGAAHLFSEMEHWMCSRITWNHSP